MKSLSTILASALLACSVMVQADQATKSPEVEVEEEKSGLFDSKLGVIPAPVIDDVLGNGVQLMVMYLHDKAEGARDPSTTFAFGQYTDSDSSVIILGHEHVFAHDEWRASLVAGRFDLNMDYHGPVGSRLPSAVKYASNGNFIFSEVRKKIVDNLYFGVQGIWSSNKANLKADATDAERNAFEDALTGSSTAGGFLVTYDTRDNGMAARQGVNVDVRSMHYTDDKTDKPYHRLEAEFSQYFAITESNTIAYRLITEHLVGNVPGGEFVSPELRGVNWNKYRGTSVYQGEIELRHQFNPKWAGVAFAGLAHVEHKEIADSGRMTPAAGIGIRYLIDPVERFSIGADIAVDKDGHNTFYLRFGEAF
ncbi:MAG: hypothetical protein V7782_11970 [Psychromonas sp.]